LRKLSPLDLRWMNESDSWLVSAAHDSRRAKK
jgi:hypothetical protein